MCFSFLKEQDKRSVYSGGLIRRELKFDTKRRNKRLKLLEKISKAPRSYGADHLRVNELWPAVKTSFVNSSFLEI